MALCLLHTVAGTLTAADAVIRHDVYRVVFATLLFALAAHNASKVLR